MYDVIVVGARCGGSPTAMLLARRGYRVLLLDRAGFPSDTLSTHCVMTPGVACLERWGLRGAVAATSCPPIRRFSFDFGGLRLSGSAPGTNGVDEQYCIRRTRLDAILVDAAVDAGVELREHFSVRELLFDDDRAVGISGGSHGGAPVREQGRLVVGADGLHSLVARSVGAATYAEKPTLACYAYSYWSGVPVEHTEACARPGGAFIRWPTNDGLTCVSVGWPIGRAAEMRADVEGLFLATIDEAADFAEGIRAGKREERFTITTVVPNFFRKPYGPGWALVGDAGYHKDPFLAQGISDAFRDAELLAAAVDDGFAERGPLDEALASYEQNRNQAAMPGYEFNAQLASQEPPPPEMVKLLGALAANQEQADRFFGVICGTVRVEEFFGSGA